jgi:restriction system protein
MSGAGVGAANKRARREAAEAERIARSGIGEIDSMTGAEFERVLLERFRALGYIANTTPTTGDFGADLVVRRNGVTTVVQAKRSARAVGIKAVQEIHAARSFYQATGAMVVTNSSFTPAARGLADSVDVELIARDQLIDRLLSPT